MDENLLVYNDGLANKIITFHQSKLSGVGVKARRKTNLAELDKRIDKQIFFRITGREKRVMEKLATEAGLSINQVACYFFVVGMEKEFSKERDKFDMASKVKRTYQDTLDAKTEEIKLLLSTELSDFKNEMQNDMKALRRESSILYILLTKVAVMARSIIYLIIDLAFKREMYPTQISLMNQEQDVFQKMAEKEMMLYVRRTLEKEEIKQSV